jgi:dihydropteroate synthase-like protein
MHSGENILFVTGKLAERSVREIVKPLASKHRFDFQIATMPITVAALMTSKWLIRHLHPEAEISLIVVPGYLQPEVDKIEQAVGIRVLAGPKDIRDLPLFFGGKQAGAVPLDDYSIEIIAEINHADRLSLEELGAQARAVVADGANIVDLGCSPGSQWLGIGDAVQCLVDEGIRVSVDSFDPQEVSIACRFGAELVLSVNSSNRKAAVDWGTEVVVIPDTPSDEKSLEESVNFLLGQGVAVRLDPILEPIGCGFAESLVRYSRTRAAFPNQKMMMGIGNITELTDADSAAINTLLLGFCEEQRIESVLTTQVINWARTSVKECDLARRVVHFAQSRRTPPKHVCDQLVMLRDERVTEFSEAALGELSIQIRDHNIRIFVANGQLQVVTKGVHIRGTDPFEVMDQLLRTPAGQEIDASHAFYLGFELSKAKTALTLSKQYEQDQALNWGYLTENEPRHRLERKRLRKS